MQINLLVDGVLHVTETEVIPVEGQQIYVKSHKVDGTYIVQSIEYDYKAIQENNIGPLKLEARVTVKLTKK